jgi:hypothetical protein
VAVFFFFFFFFFSFFFSIVKRGMSKNLWGCTYHLTNPPTSRQTAVTTIGHGRFQLAMPRVPAASVSSAATVSDFATQLLCPIYAWAPVSLQLLELAAFLLLLWVVQAATGSTWLIDPYWTLGVWGLGAAAAARAAALAGALADPLQATDPWRPRLAVQMALLTLWSARLTHSYFRRERFKFGVREDWRFAELRERYGALYRFVISLPHAYVSQFPLIAGLAAPVAIGVRTGRVLWIATAWRRAAYVGFPGYMFVYFCI